MRTLCMHTDTIFYVWECSWPFLPLKRTQYLSRKMNQLNKVNIVNMIFCFRYPSEHSIQHSRRFGILQSWLLWALLPEIFSASGGLSLIFLCDILKCKAQQRLAGKQQYRPWVLDDLWICELWNNIEVKNRGVGGGAAHGCTNDAQVTHAAAQSADRSWMFMVNGFLWNDVECHWLFNGCARKDRIPDVRHTVDRHISSYNIIYLYHSVPCCLGKKGKSRWCSLNKWTLWLFAAKVRKPTTFDVLDRSCASGTKRFRSAATTVQYTTPQTLFTRYVQKGWTAPGGLISECLRASSSLYNYNR